MVGRSGGMTPGRAGLVAGWMLLVGAAGVVAQQTVLPDGPGVQRGAAAEPGTVTGVILDPDGALIAGAKVELAVAGGAAPQVAETDGEGRYQFAGVPPGNYELTVTLAGFGRLVQAGTLEAGQNQFVKPILLRPATVMFEVEAVPQEVLAAQQLKIEEQQRLIGVFPNFYVTYQWNAAPLTTRQKFGLMLQNATDPGNLFLVGLVSAVQQADNAFPGYHQGWAGYGKRYGADLANLEVGTLLGGAVLPTLFRQDPRYFYKGTGSVRSRLLYAISSAVICRGDNGRRQPAFASVLGDLSAGAVSNLYYAPSDRQGAVLTIENGFLGVAGDAMNDVFQEFFLKKFTPKAKGGGQPVPVATPAVPSGKAP